MTSTPHLIYMIISHVHSISFSVNMLTSGASREDVSVMPSNRLSKSSSTLETNCQNVSADNKTYEFL